MPLSPVIVLVCCGLSVLMLGWLCACLKVKTFWMQICFYHLDGSFFSFLNIFYINFLCLWSRFRLVSPQFESLPPNPTPSFPFSLPWFCVDPSDVSSCLGSSPPDESSMVKIRGDCVGLVLLRRIVFIKQKWAESAWRRSAGMIEGKLMQVMRGKWFCFTQAVGGTWYFCPISPCCHHDIGYFQSQRYFDQ